MYVTEQLWSTLFYINHASLVTVKLWKREFWFCEINGEPRPRFTLLRGFPGPRKSVRGWDQLLLAHYMAYASFAYFFQQSPFCTKNLENQAIFSFSLQIFKRWRAGSVFPYRKDKQDSIRMFVFIRIENCYAAPSNGTKFDHKVIAKHFLLWLSPLSCYITIWYSKIYLISFRRRISKENTGSEEKLVKWAKLCGNGNHWNPMFTRGSMAYWNRLRNQTLGLKPSKLWNNDSRRSVTMILTH